ncbi:MAG TPA: alginate export family protein [Acidobacteriaceae bacterium]|nr:alginate export family protein [Acidobacteriaceae bacterium]
MNRLSVAFAALLTAVASSAQSASTPVTATVVLRERTNATQWFSATPAVEQYGHQDSLLRLGIQQRIHQWDYQLELLQAAELFLPTDAVSPVTAQGQFGLGATYYASNGNNEFPAAASFKTGFLRYHFNESSTLRLGRFEFLDGQETTPRNSTLAWLQTNRIAQRLIGNFGFSNGQRSFDGLDASTGGGKWNLTAMAGRATQGVFNMNANPELNVDLQYLAYTRGLARQHLLVRGFALGYHDGRTGVVKTDNRPLAIRQADHTNIRIGSYGADAIAAIPAGRNAVDLLFWGALQNGRWGALDQHSGGFAAEAGFRLDHVRSTPWLRAGVLRTTGDNNPNDGVHNTFFQVLPTPRTYARYPFFNMMNSKEEFLQLIDKPAKKLDIRTDLHFLQFTAPADLWYQGGGAFDHKVFGYTGRPANNHSSFSSLYDVSADYVLNSQLSLGLYYARAFGKSVVTSIYPVDHDSNYGYFELSYKLSKPLRQ